MLQYLRAHASAKPGIVQLLGEKTMLWHGEKCGSVDGEHFLGEVVAYDPEPMAVYLQFREVTSGRLSRAEQYDDWVQTWRSDEYLVRPSSKHLECTQDVTCS
jgi:hypothetical protein